MADSSMIEVLRWVPGAVSTPDLDAVQALRARAYRGMFPETDAGEAERQRERIHRHWVEGRDADRGALMHVGVVDGVFVAAAHSFVRTIGTEAGDLDVLALAGVATEPARRRAGFGTAVVLDALARVERGEVPLCLFQTGPARGFYERLGCVTADNRFVNSVGDPPEASPWFDDWVMRYPAAAAWPGGEVDLRGPGY